MDMFVGMISAVEQTATSKSHRSSSGSLSIDPLKSSRGFLERSPSLAVLPILSTVHVGCMHRLQEMRTPRKLRLKWRGVVCRFADQRTQQDVQRCLEEDSLNTHPGFWAAHSKDKWPTPAIQSQQFMTLRTTLTPAHGSKLTVSFLRCVI